MSKKLWSLVAVIMVVSMLITACAPTAQPTQAPAPQPARILRRHHCQRPRAGGDAERADRSD